MLSKIFVFNFIMVIAFVSSGCTALDGHYRLPDAQFIEGDSEPMLSGSFSYDGSNATGQSTASTDPSPPATGLLYAVAVILAVPLFTSMLICWGETPVIFCNL